jgi:hypothetical protein
MKQHPWYDDNVFIRMSAIAREWIYFCKLVLMVSVIYFYKTAML